MGCQLNKTFRFKQFCIESGGQSMSVGTDGVLLGAWAEAPQATTFLDIGTGSGVIALMLAQRFPHAAITGIDINELAIEIARKNANSSPFKQNTEFINIDARSFVANKKFDLIVSNPPFFPTGSLESGTARAKARSFETLTLQQLIKCASNNISKQGTFAVIIPYDLAENFEFLAWEKDFFPVRCTDVVTVSNKPPKRKLMQFAPSSQAIKEQTNNTLTLTTSDGKKTDEYISLTKDFYLDK